MPVNQITVSGNYLEMIARIVAVADDLKFMLPSGGCFGCPSVFAGEMNISGK